MLSFCKKVSELKIEKGGEGLFQNLNDLFKTSVIDFFTLYSTLLYSTTTILHTNDYLTTTLFANCKRMTTLFAGVVN